LGLKDHRVVKPPAARRGLFTLRHSVADCFSILTEPVNQYVLISFVVYMLRHGFFSTYRPSNGSERALCE